MPTQSAAKLPRNGMPKSFFSYVAIPGWNLSLGKLEESWSYVRQQQLYPAKAVNGSAYSTVVVLKITPPYDDDDDDDDDDDELALQNKLSIERLKTLHLRATVCHLPYGITQCYPPSDTSKHTPS